MNRTSITLVLTAAVIFAGAGGSVAAAIDGSKRYGIITARSPFGSPPAKVIARKAAPVIPQPSSKELNFAKSIRVASMRRRRNSVRVGLYDSRTKTSLMMFPGDEKDGITLVKADYDQGKVLLRKGVVEQWVSNDSKGSTPSASSPTATSARKAPRMPKRLSYAERIARRRKSREEAKKNRKPPKYTGEELQKHLKNYQMDLIRAGGTKGPPLPLPLTSEMDAQLVQEGVLPPM